MYYYSLGLSSTIYIFLGFFFLPFPLIFILNFFFFFEIYPFGLCQVLASKSPTLLDFHVDLVSLEAASKVSIITIIFSSSGCLILKFMNAE